jgi:hypothetical protein
MFGGIFCPNGDDQGRVERSQGLRVVPGLKLLQLQSKVHAMVTSNMGRNGGGEDTLARWRSFTSFTHPLRQLPRRLLAKCADQGLQAGPSLCTQAYCKFLQIAAAHPTLLEVPEEENEAMKGLRLDGGGREQRKTLRFGTFLIDFYKLLNAS